MKREGADAKVGARPTGDAHISPRFVDLQVHTTASDGILSPADVVAFAAKVNLSAIALTDHDSISGIEEAEREAEKFGIRIVPGVELAAHFEGDELHILGLHLQDRDSISVDLNVFRGERIARAEMIIQILNKNGIQISLDSVLSEAGRGAVGRPHIARVLVASGKVKDFREAFDKWLGWGKPAFVEKGHLTAEEAIALIHRSGGLAIWAHPADMATEARLSRLKNIGMDGVEILHPSHPQPLAERLYDRAERLDLLPSGGSDWHGSSLGPRQLGGQHVPHIWLDRQDYELRERRG